MTAIPSCSPELGFIIWKLHKRYKLDAKEISALLNDGSYYHAKRKKKITLELPPKLRPPAKVMEEQIKSSLDKTKSELKTDETRRRIFKTFGPFIITQVGKDRVIRLKPDVAGLLEDGTIFASDSLRERLKTEKGKVLD